MERPATRAKLSRIPSSYQSPSLDRRLLVVSNRLPVTVKRKDDGTYDLSMSSGGLVAAVSGLAKAVKFEWFGWPGISIPEDETDQLTNQLKDEYNAVPVFMDKALADSHYNGFSNSIIWPLFHYHPGEMKFDETAWESYKEANRLFAKQIASRVQEKDMIWVHDYHLMLLPQMLREELGESKKDVKIGFFLHTPFPSSEVYRMLPVREEILYGLLHADLCGFHTFDYARHFLSSCQKILGYSTTPSSVNFDGKRVTVGTFPVGIEPEKFTQKLEEEPIKKRISVLRRKFADTKIILGVDRLDYIKGLPQKLHAFETLFEMYPELIGKVTLVQVAVPSREDVEDYQSLREVVNELVGRVNGRYGTVDYTPIHFMYRNQSFDELVALYAVADGCLVTSTRDGMNLVCYEYIACQQEGKGVTLLSEFTGAAESLSKSVIFNPWDIASVARAIHTAVSMDEAKRADSFDQLSRYIKKFTSRFWGQSFISELSRTLERPV